MRKEITYEEAKKVIDEYPEDEHYIQEHYQMWYSHTMGMDDNSIDLYEYWHRCKKIVDDHKLTQSFQ